MMLAYIDPGLGALLWQTIIAALVGVVFYLKRTRQWIVALFRKMFGRTQKTETTVVEPPATSAESKPVVR
jgi:hypothetical protein